jgi:membrane protease YdiL (CAAX protease family)
MTLTVASRGGERRRRGWAVVTLAVGVLLYFLPTLVLPVLASPIDQSLRALGLLGGGAGGFERIFGAAMVVRWLAVVLLLLYVPFVEREPLSSIGVRMPRPVDLLLALCTAAVTIVVGGGLYLLAGALTHGAGTSAGTQGANIAQTLGVAGRIQVALNAGVVEELLFRAVLIGCLLRLDVHPVTAAAISTIVFAASHYFTGSETLLYSVVVDGVAGVTFSTLYLLRRNVVANALAHFVCDLVAIVIL